MRREGGAWNTPVRVLVRRGDRRSVRPWGGGPRKRRTSRGSGGGRRSSGPSTSSSSTPRGPGAPPPNPSCPHTLKAFRKAKGTPPPGVQPPNWLRTLFPGPFSRDPLSVELHLMTMAFYKGSIGEGLAFSRPAVLWAAGGRTPLPPEDRQERPGSPFSLPQPQRAAVPGVPVPTPGGHPRPPRPRPPPPRRPGPSGRSSECPALTALGIFGDGKMHILQNPCRL